MSEEKETPLTKGVAVHNAIEISFEELELKPQVRLSPSSINTFYKCPRSYFYNYITKMRVANIHMIKGTIVHNTLEWFFKAYPKKGGLQEHMETLFQKAWKGQEKQIKQLELTDDEKSEALRDCYAMADDYYLNFVKKCTRIIEADKAENIQHAYYLLKPKFREIFVEDKDLHCCGYIDRIHKDFDGFVTLGDYKTSKRYGIGINEDYVRQLSIYALLYNLQEGVLPDFVSVIFLRYGEEPILQVTPSLLAYARTTILDVWGKTRSVLEEDYPLKEGPLCKWCGYQNLCSGECAWQDKLREQKLIESIEAKKNEHE